jgi:hypothetical protein
MRASLAAGVLLLLGSIAVGQQPSASSYNARPVATYDYGTPQPAVVSAPIPQPVIQIGSAGTPVVSSSTPTQAQWVSPVPVAPVILRTSGTGVPGLVRQGKMRRDANDDDRPEFQVQVNPPGLERLSQIDSDAKLEERIRQETLERTKNEQVVFPEEPILSRETYMGRVGLWPTRQMVVEPNYVAYQKLYFQQNNFERFGWDLGPITPVVCTGKFYYDLLTMPLTFGARPCERDASTGYPLPGDPVPLLLYPPEITLTGAILEVGAVAALAAIFP